MSNENQNLNHFGEAILQKFVNEEIMTKSELNQQLDNVMSKYVAHIDGKFDLVDKQIQSLKVDMDARFEQVDKRFAHIDLRYNWIIGLVVTATIGIISIVIKLH